MSRGWVPLEGRAASPRALLYAGYAQLLGFPDPGLEGGLDDGSVGADVAEWHQAAGLLHPAPELGPSRHEPLESMYIATFDIGVPEPPVPLYESAYLDEDKASRRGLLEELVRFYEHFDLDLGDDPSEAPDHLTVELEFMAALAQMEHLASARGVDPSSFRRAQHDFLDRHLVDFVHRICSRPVPEGFYRQVAEALREVVEDDRTRLVETLDVSTT